MAGFVGGFGSWLMGCFRHIPACPPWPGFRHPCRNDGFSGLHGLVHIDEISCLFVAFHREAGALKTTFPSWKLGNEQNWKEPSFRQGCRNDGFSGLHGLVYNGQNSSMANPAASYAIMAIVLGMRRARILIRAGTGFFSGLLEPLLFVFQLVLQFHHLPLHADQFALGRASGDGHQSQ